jgi:hypothetical protein
MSKEKILVVNSKDRSSGTNSEFTLDFKADSSVQQVLKILVKEIFCPNQFYNITTLNNELEIQQSTFPNAIIEIPEGQYNINQLIAELEAQFLLVLQDGCSVVITKNDNTSKLTFTFSGATNPANNFVALQIGGATNINEVLGFIQNTPKTPIFTLPLPYNLNPLQYVQIHSPDIGDLHGLDGGRIISLVETISLTDTAYGGVAYKQNNDDELCEILYESPRNLSNIKVVLRDDTGLKLTLPDNHYFTMTLKIYYD